jgi:hypothetical protein
MIVEILLAVLMNIQVLGVCCEDANLQGGHKAEWLKGTISNAFFEYGEYKIQQQ